MIVPAPKKRAGPRKDRLFSVSKKGPEEQLEIVKEEKTASRPLPVIAEFPEVLGIVEDSSDPI